jgi:acetolactate synthase-1/2/3 large subunit
MSREQNSVLLDNALATMGAGLPSGIATKLLYPDKKVLVIAGDGGIMMNIAELETAIRLKVNLVILIVNDSSYGMIRWKQKNMKLEEFALSFNNPNFIKLAESFGAFGYEIKSADELAPLLEKTLNSEGVHIINCPTSYEAANEVLGSVKNIKVV